MSSTLLFPSSDKIALSSLEITHLSSLNHSLRSRTQFLEEIIFLLVMEIQRLNEIIEGDSAEFEKRNKEANDMKEGSASYRSEVIKEKIKKSYLELFKYHDRNKEDKLHINNDWKENSEIDKKEQHETTDKNINHIVYEKNDDNLNAEQEFEIVPIVNNNFNYDLKAEQGRHSLSNEQQHRQDVFKERTVHLPLLKDDEDDDYNHHYLKEEFRLVNNNEGKDHTVNNLLKQYEDSINEEMILRIEEQEKNLEQARKRIQDLEREKEGKVDIKDVHNLVEKILNKEKGEKHLNETHIKVIVDSLISELNDSYYKKHYHFQSKIQQLELELEEMRGEMIKTENKNKLMKQKLIEYSDFASDIEEIMEKGKKNDIKKFRLKELSEDFATKLAFAKEKFNRISQKI